MLPQGSPLKLSQIEVKSTTRPRVEDARHLQSFREEYGNRSRPGLLLDAGDRTEWLAPKILAAALVAHAVTISAISEFREVQM
jgi:hypothetical protein